MQSDDVSAPWQGPCWHCSASRGCRRRRCLASWRTRHPTPRRATTARTAHRATCRHLRVTARPAARTRINRSWTRALPRRCSWRCPVLVVQPVTQSRSLSAFGRRPSFGPRSPRTHPVRQFLPLPRVEPLPAHVRQGRVRCSHCPGGSLMAQECPAPEQGRLNHTRLFRGPRARIARGRLPGGSASLGRGPALSLAPQSDSRSRATPCCSSSRRVRRHARTRHRGGAAHGPAAARRRGQRPHRRLQLHGRRT